MDRCQESFLKLVVAVALHEKRGEHLQNYRLLHRESCVPRGLPLATLSMTKLNNFDFMMLPALQIAELLPLTKIFINKPLSLKNMGRIKTAYIKRKTKELFNLHGEKFSTDYAQNKDLTNQLAIIPSKKIRNVIAGYMTRLKRKEQ